MKKLFILSAVLATVATTSQASAQNASQSGSHLSTSSKAWIAGSALVVGTLATWGFISAVNNNSSSNAH